MFASVDVVSARDTRYKRLVNEQILMHAALAGRLQNERAYSAVELVEALAVFMPSALECKRLKSELQSHRNPFACGDIDIDVVRLDGRRRFLLSGLPSASALEVAVHYGDNLTVLPTLRTGSYELIYIDPPFNTGYDQQRTRLRTVEDSSGDRVGFAGKRYRTEEIGSSSFADSFDNFMGFLEPRLREAHRLLTDEGALFFHIDYREAHYCKVLLDQIFGRDSFMNEIVWAYDYGARSKKRWSAKHDVIFWYAKNPKQYTFNHQAMDRIPYMAPGLVGAEKAAKGKTPTDVWWHTIVPTAGKERTGYPTQKPLGILRRIIAVHTNPGDRVLDFFAGSGTTAVAAREMGRSATLIDANPEALAVIEQRLEPYGPIMHGWDSPSQPSQQGG